MKKIRGFKRKIKQIEYWKHIHLIIDFENLNKYHKDYAKFRLYPWNPVAMSMYNFPNPKGRIKKLILESFLEIYNSWNDQLKSLNKPYYLKIWLFEPNIYLSQIVCAIDEKIDYYENIFHKPEHSKDFTKSIYYLTSQELKDYNWEYYLEEYPFFEEDMAPDNFYDIHEFKKFERALKKRHRVVYTQVDNLKMILLPGDDVWVGESKASS